MMTKLYFYLWSVIKHSKNKENEIIFVEKSNLLVNINIQRLLNLCGEVHKRLSEQRKFGINILASEHQVEQQSENKIYINSMRISFLQIVKEHLFATGRSSSDNWLSGSDWS